MPIAALKFRYAAVVDRVLDSLSEVERRDVQAFDAWFYRDGGWRFLLAIIGATTLIAWVASLLPWNMTFLEAALLFNVLVIALGWSVLSAWFGYRRFTSRLFRIAIVAFGFAMLGGLAGGTFVDMVRGREPFAWLMDSARLRHVIIAGLVFGGLYAVLITLITTLRNREHAARTARLVAEARQSELSRQLAESKLRLLQLQIEPHFLFNTLGSAQQLAEKGAPDAARLIADLIRLLRAAMPALREEASTLAQEAALISAYLDIIGTRLGARLRWSVDIPDDLSGRVVPPGMLITLVENAVKHGIEPMPSGGRIDVTAKRVPAPAGECLTITVTDTGAGLAAAPGQGIGLANIRDRLALLHGARARLELDAMMPHGFVARIVLPLDGAGRSLPFAAAPIATGA